MSASTIPMFTDRLGNPYRSDRLIYRSVQNSEEDRTFIDSHMLNDPINMVLSSTVLLRPEPAKTAESATESMLKSLLAVMACLPAEEVEGEAASDRKPTTIGYVILGWGGPGPLYRYHHRSSELAIAVGAPWQGKGYGEEMLNWALDWAFRYAGLHSVTLGCLEFNTRAQRTYEKVGFVLDGKQREGHFLDRRWWGIYMYSMLESEWEARRGLQKA